MIKKFSTTCAILILLFTLTACKSDASTIVGVWDMIDEKGNAWNLELKNNDTYLLSLGMFQVGGTYTFEENLLTLTKSEDKMFYEIEKESAHSMKFFSVDEDGSRNNEENGTMTRKEN